MQGSLFVEQSVIGQHGLSEQEKPAVAGVREVIRQQDLWSLLDKQAYRCAMTGRELTPETASVDHKTPLSRGGDHAVSNLQIVHFQVNSAKGTMTEEEFVNLCREVVKHHDG